MEFQWKIEAGSPAKDRAIRDAINELVVTDEVGLTSDRVEVTFNDPDARFDALQEGDKIRVHLGGNGEPLSFFGEFVVSEVEISEFRYKVVGVSADVTASLKAIRNRTFTEEKTMGALVDVIAKEHGLKGTVSKGLKDVPCNAIRQSNESTIHFLVRTAKRYAATVKINGGKLIVIERDLGTSASGAELASAVIEKKQTASWRMASAARTEFKSVRAIWHDIIKDEERVVVAGNGEPQFELKKKFESAVEATKAAKEKLRETKRASLTLSFSGEGSSKFRAERRLDARGFHKRVDGQRWVITRATHRISPAGYSVSVECEASEA
jgi:phage protein D